jgi:hypothetical protein
LRKTATKNALQSSDFTARFLFVQKNYYQPVILMVSAALGGRLGNIPNPIKNEHKNLIKGTSLNRVMGLWAGGFVWRPTW